MTPHRLIEAHLSTVEEALDQMPDIRVDRYLEEALTPKRMNLRIRIRFTNGNLLEVNEALQIESEVLFGWIIDTTTKTPKTSSFSDTTIPHTSQIYPAFPITNISPIKSLPAPDPNSSKSSKKR